MQHHGINNTVDLLEKPQHNYPTRYLNSRSVYPIEVTKQVSRRCAVQHFKTFHNHCPTEFRNDLKLVKKKYELKMKLYNYLSEIDKNVLETLMN